MARAQFVTVALAIATAYIPPAPVHRPAVALRVGRPSPGIDYGSWDPAQRPNPLAPPKKSKSLLGALNPFRRREPAAVAQEIPIAPSPRRAAPVDSSVKWGRSAPGRLNDIALQKLAEQANAYSPPVAAPRSGAAGAYHASPADRPPQRPYGATPAAGLGAAGLGGSADAGASEWAARRAASAAAPRQPPAAVRQPPAAAPPPPPTGPRTGRFGRTPAAPTPSPRTPPASTPSPRTPAASTPAEAARARARSGPRPVDQYGADWKQGEKPRIDDDRRMKSPGLQNNFYETSTADFRRPHGAGAAPPGAPQGRAAPPAPAPPPAQWTGLDAADRWLSEATGERSPIDDDRRMQSPGLQNNFYESSTADFKRPHGARAPPSGFPEPGAPQGRAAPPALASTPALASMPAPVPPPAPARPSGDAASRGAGAADARLEAAAARLEAADRALGAAVAAAAAPVPPSAQLTAVPRPEGGTFEAASESSDDAPAVVADASFDVANAALDAADRAADAAAASAASVAVAAAAALPAGWSAAVDPTSGNTYYYNGTETRWDAPMA